MTIQVCHRIAERSFFYGDTQSLFCARCSGLYVTFLIAGILVMIATKPNESFAPSRGTRAAAWFGILITVADVAMGAYHLHAIGTGERALTGAFGGTGLAVLFVPVAWRECARVILRPAVARVVSVTFMTAGIASLTAATYGLRAGAATDILTFAGFAAYLTTFCWLANRIRQRFVIWATGHVFGARPNRCARLALLDGVSDPADRPPDREQHERDPIWQFSAYARARRGRSRSPASRRGLLRRSMLRRARRRALSISDNARPAIRTPASRGSPSR